MGLYDEEEYQPGDGKSLFIYLVIIGAIAVFVSWVVSQL